MSVYHWMRLYTTSTQIQTWFLSRSSRIELFNSPKNNRSDLWCSTMHIQCCIHYSRKLIANCSSMWGVGIPVTKLTTHGVRGSSKPSDTASLLPTALSISHQSWSTKWHMFLWGHSLIDPNNFQAHLRSKKDLAPSRKVNQVARNMKSHEYNGAGSYKAGYLLSHNTLKGNNK